MMETLGDFHFIRPLWLLTIPTVFVVWWFWRRSVDPLRGWRKQIEPELLDALIIDDKSVRDHRSYWLLTAWILAAIAIAGPTWRVEPNPFAKDAQPLVIVLKAGESMQSIAASPTPLQRAQLKITDLAKARKGDPLGLVAYAGSSHTVLPPTEDTGIVAEMAAEISPNIMPVPGDRLDHAILTAGRLLSGRTGGGSLLIVADKADIDPREVADAHQSVGSPPVQFLTLTSDDSPETQTLRAVAELLDGAVQNVTVDDEDVEAILDFAERRAVAGVSGESSRWQEAGYWLTPVLALLATLSFRRRQVVTSETSR